jgi:hypothetical protein
LLLLFVFSSLCSLYFFRHLQEVSTEKSSSSDIVPQSCPCASRGMGDLLRVTRYFESLAFRLALL